MHGVIMVFFFLIPSIPAMLGNFLMPMMIGAKDLAFPRINLLSWYLYIPGRRPHPVGRSSPAASTPAGPSTRRSRRTYSNGYVVLDHPGHLHRRLLVDPHRAQLHRHHPPDARAGADLVPAAAVRLVALRHQPDHRPRHPGAGDHPAAGGRRAHLAPRDLRPRPGRRPGAVPAPVLVLLAPGGLHHDPAGDGRDQRAHRLLLAQAHLRLPLRRLRLDRHRGARLPGLGPPHVRGLGSRSTPGWSSRCCRCWSRSPRRSRSSTGPRRCTRGRSRSRRRCSTRSASSGCSPSAG